MQLISKIGNKKNLFFKIVIMAFMFFGALTLFTGCASTDKNKTGAATSKEISYSYNAETNITRIDFSLYFENNTIYNFTKEQCNFKLFKNDVFDRNENFIWNYTIKANSSNYSNVYIIVNGEINKIELCEWSPTFDNLWNSYKTWWLISIISPVVLAIVYLIVILVMDLELSDVFESIGTWISTAIILAISFISPIISGESNWFPFIICLIGVIGLLILCLGMSGIKALLDLNGINPLENLSASIEQKKEERNYKRFLEPINKCGTDKKALNKFEKAYLAQYCDEMDISCSGRRKADLVEAISAYANGDTSVLKQSNKKEKTNIKESKRVKTSSITFNDIAGLDSAKEVFREKVVLPFEHPDLYKKFGKKSGGGILLYGLPGTGKTMFAEAASNEVDALFIPIKCSDIKSKWYGESEKNIKDIFNKARKSQRAVIFFDEFEAIGSKRTDSADNGNNDLVPQILAEMQGVGTSTSESTIVVIAATNKPWSIDSAFLRPGRFDEKIYIPLPDAKAREKLFELKLKNVPSENLDYQKLSSATDGFNGADITEFCEKLKMLAINKSIKDGKEHLISMDDAIKVSNSIKSSVSYEDIERLKQFEEQ